jgi:uncharacterized protein (TIGR02246 family)
MRYSRTLMLVTGVMLAVPGAVPADQADETAIRKRVQEYVDAWNRGDAKAAAAVYAVDGTHTYVLGFTHRGRVAIEKGLEELLAGSWKGTRITLKTNAVRFLKPDVAVEDETFTVAGLKTPEGTELPAVEGPCLVVHQKRDGEWFAAAVQCGIPPEGPDKARK